VQSDRLVRRIGGLVETAQFHQVGRESGITRDVGP
jgi:hypothetical protein